MKSNKNVWFLTVICLVLAFTAQSALAQSWTRLLSSGTAPDPRTDASAVYDAGSNNLIVFGGTDKRLYVRSQFERQLSPHQRGRPLSCVSALD